MSASPVTVDADATVRERPRLLADGDIGALPVVSGGKLAGIVTDRDLVVRVLAGNLDLSAPIGEIASAGICSVSPDASLDEAAAAARRGAASAACRWWTPRAGSSASSRRPMSRGTPDTS